MCASDLFERVVPNRVAFESAEKLFLLSVPTDRHKWAGHTVWMPAITCWNSI